MKRHLLALLFAVSLFGRLLAQPQLITLLPDHASPGDELDVQIVGSETHFQQGVSQADFGSDIVVQDLQVQSEVAAVAHVLVAGDAAPGFRTVRVITGAEIAELSNGFEIREATGDVLVQIQVIPVNVLYLSDLDPQNPQDAPLLFTITVINDDQQRNLTVRLGVSGSTGELVIATRGFSQVAPGATLVFDNREFDDYQTTPAGDALIAEASQTGMLPPDDYRFHVQVLDDKGNLIAEDEGTITTTNPTSQLELIAPGSPFTEAPEEIFTTTPFFQWFATGGTFDFALYPVFSGQTAPEDVVQNRPAHQQQGLTVTNLAYPPFAEPLVEGRTYAWQVVAKIPTSSGTATLTSPVYWFRIGGSQPGGGSISRIQVIPQQVTLQIGQSQSFQALVFNATGQPVNRPVSWRVVPSLGGTIDPSGLFTAGTRPMAVAVVAEADGQENYATAVIEWTAAGLDMETFLRELFGLPASP